MESRISIIRCMVLFCAFSAGLLHLVNSKCSIPGSPFKKFENSGTVQSPCYPDRYHGNEECDWEINPPIGSTAELLIVRIRKFETNATNEDNCFDETVENYVDLGPHRACGNVSAQCIAYMLTATRHGFCHDKADNEYPECPKHLFKEWPFEISFRTARSDDQAGFKLDYNIVECRNLSVTTPAELTTTPQNTEEESSQNNSELILTLTLLGVVLLAVIVAIIFRKQIHTWAKSQVEKHSSSNPGDANVVPMEDIIDPERNVSDAKDPRESPDVVML